MISIPFHQHNGYVSGIVTFMENLRIYLKARNYSYTTKLQGSDTIFFPVKYNQEELAILKEAGGRIIQRLDGIYYPQKHAGHYEALNLDIKEIYKHYADFVIFQSDHSRAQCFEMFGEPKSAFTTIYNGVDKSIFFPDPSVSWTPTNKLKFITTGGFRNIDMIEPLVLALDKLMPMLHFELSVVGPIQNESLKPFLNRDYINYLGKQNNDDIAMLLREHHIFLYAHLNPPCPNSVLEAISTGLPVVGFDSGAMSELCHFSKELLSYVSDDIFQLYQDFNYEKLQEKIMLAVNEYPQCRKQALMHSHLYDFEDTGAAYVVVFEQVREEAELTFNQQRYCRLASVYQLEKQFHRWYHRAKNILLGRK